MCKICLSGAFLVLAAGCTLGPPEGVTPVDDFDVERYLGTWHEVARLDHRFERGLVAVTAEYALREDGGGPRAISGWTLNQGTPPTSGRLRAPRAEHTAERLTAP